MSLQECAGFWLVWREDGDAPTFKHKTEREAVDEAKRLAKANPGVRFYVLSTDHAFIKDDVRAERPVFEIPF